MSRDCVALPRGVMSLSAVCDFVVFPDHTGLLFLFMNVDILKDAKKQTDLKLNAKYACVYNRPVYFVI